MNLLIDVLQSYSNGRIGIEISQHPKKYFLNSYSFYTFEIFATNSKKNADPILKFVKKFTNKIIVIDESHTIIRLSDVKV